MTTGAQGMFTKTCKTHMPLTFFSKQIFQSKGFHNSPVQIASYFLSEISWKSAYFLSPSWFSLSHDEIFLWFNAFSS